MSSSCQEKRRIYDFGSKNDEVEKTASYSRLYLDFYNLKSPPFTITPDPEFLYSSSTHSATIENILYGIEACMGFILLIGEIGTGKTTICRSILDKLEGRAETVYMINPSLSGIEVIQAVLDDLGLAYPAGSSKKILLDCLNRFLLEAPPEKPVVIIIDDAQTMTQDGLENLRLLSNLETDKKKLLQLVLVGQQELQQLLSQPGLRQLKQRITLCCQLDHISCSELKQYITLRLFVAGDNGKVNFSEAAVREIYKASRGIPRLINIICDYAMTAGYISDSPVIEKEHARRAINELRHQSLIDKSSLSGMASLIQGRRTGMELLILFAVLLFLIFIYSKETFNKNPMYVAAQAKNETVRIADPAPDNDVPDSDILPMISIREDSPVEEHEIIPPQNTKGSIVEAHGSYILQLASFKTRYAAVREAASLRQRGLDTHWNAVHLKEKGIWYRVYLGGFSTKEEVMVFKKAKDITNGIIIHAPWTLLIESKDRTETPEDIFSVLQKNGLDCMIDNDGDSERRLLSGAFRNIERAQKAVPEMLEMGFDAKPILR